jgi:outer membrane lipoprotein-sorting protein
MKTAANLLILAAVALAAAQAQTTDEIVCRMMERDQARQSTLGSYSWISTYTLDNKDRHAEMQVRWKRNSDGTKQYTVVYERGDGGVRDHVFHKLLESEVEASRPEIRDRNRMNTKNYTFRLTGSEEIGGRLAYVLEVQPKVEAKYLTSGRIWVDAEDYAVVQVEGSPAKRPSFWTKSVSFTQTFEKQGQFWVAACNKSVTDAKIFGKADLVIRHSDYRFNAAGTAVTD